jgi:prefoldin subunit 5
LSAAGAPLPVEPNPPESKGSFFSSPAGISLIVLLSVLLVAGIVTGVLLAVRSGSDEDFGDELARVWAEYEDLVEEADRELVQISFDAASLDRQKEGLEKARLKVEALEQVLKNLEPPDDRWRVKYDQLAGALNYYNRYLEKLSELYVTIAAGALKSEVDVVQSILSELEKLAVKVKGLADDFLAGNTAVTSTGFNPEVLDLPKEITAEVEKALKSDSDTDGDTGRTDNESEDAARAVLQRVLGLYADGGWQAITGYMTPALLEAFESAPVSWDQVSYDVTGTNIESAEVEDPGTVVFRVMERRDDFGDIYSEPVDWEMVETGGAWLVNNATNEYGESKL